MGKRQPSTCPKGGRLTRDGSTEGRQGHLRFVAWRPVGRPFSGGSGIGGQPALRMAGPLRVRDARRAAKRRVAPCRKDRGLSSAMGSRPCGPRRCRLVLAWAPPQLLRWRVASSGTPANERPCSQPPLMALRLVALLDPFVYVFPFLTLLWSPHALWAVALVFLGYVHLPPNQQEKTLSTTYLAGGLLALCLPLYFLYALYFCQVTMLHGDEGPVPARHSEPSPRRRHGPGQQPRTDRRVPRHGIRGTQGARALPRTRSTQCTR